jgi:hypothetical protein
VLIELVCFSCVGERLVERPLMRGNFNPGEDSDSRSGIEVLSSGTSAKERRRERRVSEWRSAEASVCVHKQASSETLMLPRRDS